jgi:hypothetical protein
MAELRHVAITVPDPEKAKAAGIAASGWRAK